MTPILITGAAGFIGAALARTYLDEGRAVVGLDNLNAYYDVTLKEARLARLTDFANFELARIDLADAGAVKTLFAEHRFETVINLAAQAGVRYSIEHPDIYIQSNIVGFLNVLEACRHNAVRHLLYASSSSVYGANTGMPFSVEQPVDHPLSLYGATKKANELMAHSYSHLFGLPTTGLRFFTVYGPWGRPDMAPFLFTKAIIEGQAVKVFNHGRLSRDFTYVDDIVESVRRLAEAPAAANPEWDGAHPDPATSKAPYRVYNIGNHEPVDLLEFIALIERKLGVAARLEMLPLPPGDVPRTFADVEALYARTGFKPATSIEDGVGRFIDWYRDFYGV